MDTQLWPGPIIIDIGEEEWSKILKKGTITHKLAELEKEYCTEIHETNGMIVLRPPKENMTRSGELQKYLYTADEIGVYNQKPIPANKQKDVYLIPNATGKISSKIYRDAWKNEKELEESIAEKEFLSFLICGRLTVHYAADSVIENMPITSPRYGGIDLWRQRSVLNVCNEVIDGVTAPMTYTAMKFSSFALHQEDGRLYSVNYLDAGSPKTWFYVPPMFSAKVRTLLMEVVQTESKQRTVYKDFKNNCYECPNYIQHKTLFATPEFFLRNGLEPRKYVQRPGEYVLVSPSTYHEGFSHGFNSAWGVNYAMPRWFPHAEQALYCTIPCPLADAAVRFDIPTLKSTATYVGYVDGIQDDIISERIRTQQKHTLPNDDKLFCGDNDCNRTNCTHVDVLPPITEDMMEIVRWGMSMGDDDEIVGEFGKLNITRDDIWSLAVDCPVYATIAYGFMEYLRNRSIKHPQHFTNVNYCKTLYTDQLLLWKDTAFEMEWIDPELGAGDGILILLHRVFYSKHDNLLLVEETQECIPHIAYFLADKGERTLEYVDSMPATKLPEEHLMFLKRLMEKMTSTDWSIKPKLTYTPMRDNSNDCVIAGLRFAELRTRLTNQKLFYDFFDLKQFRKLLTCILCTRHSSHVGLDFFINPTIATSTHNPAGKGVADKKRHMKKNKWVEPIGQDEWESDTPLQWTDTNKFVAGFGRAPENNEWVAHDD